MRELISTPAIKSASSFASLLESFTASAKRKDEIWDDSSMRDDVATISYEQALRSHRRVPPVTPLPDDESDHRSRSVAELAGPPTPPLAAVEKRKSASITIRLSEAERVQLHERAASAGLSVSAYLRSCIFEAESLRAQVKEALSQIRTVEINPAQPSPASPVPSWRARLLPHWPRRASA